MLARLIVATVLMAGAIAQADTKPAPPVAAAAAIPDTPAGRTLRAWLDAFNSGDRARIEAYGKTYEPTQPTAQLVEFRRMTGGFKLLGIDKSEPLHIEFHVQEQASPKMAVGRLDVKDGNPAIVVAFKLRLMPARSEGRRHERQIDGATRARVIDGIAARLSEFYVYADGAKKMIEALRAHQKKGEYDGVRRRPHVRRAVRRAFACRQPRYASPCRLCAAGVAEGRLPARSAQWIPRCGRA